MCSPCMSDDSVNLTGVNYVTLHDIILHSQEGSGGNESSTLNSSSNTGHLIENPSPSVEVGIDVVLPTFTTQSCVDAIGNTDNSIRILNVLRTKNSERLVIGHININVIENKFNSLVSLVKDKIDIIMISETKIDDSFP